MRNISKIDILRTIIIMIVLSVLCSCDSINGAKKKCYDYAKADLIYMGELCDTAARCTNALSNKITSSTVEIGFEFFCNLQFAKRKSMSINARDLRGFVCACDMKGREECK